MPIAEGASEARSALPDSPGARASAHLSDGERSGIG